MTLPIEVPLVSANESNLSALGGLYRSTFVYKLQARFRLMLSGIYSVYVTSVEEGFDTALRAHLVDVLNDVLARTDELTDVFGQFLEDFFDEISRQIVSGEDFTQLETVTGNVKSFVVRSRDTFDEDRKIEAFIVESIATAEQRFGASMHAASKDYLDLLGAGEGSLLPPLSAQGAFLAFANVLGRVAVPIHARIRLAMYSAFNQEVLPHIQEACQAFRDELPLDLDRLGSFGWASHLPGVNLAAELPWAGRILPAGEYYSGGGFLQNSSSSLANSSSSDQESAGGYVPSIRSGTRSRDGLAASRLVRWSCLLFLSATILLPFWHPEAAAFLKSRFAPEIQSFLPMSNWLKSSPTDQFRMGHEHQSRTWYARLREVQIEDTSILLDPASDALLYKFRLINGTDRPIRQIEVICMQLSAESEPIEVSKAVLPVTIASHEAMQFEHVPMGFINRKASQRRCIPSDFRDALVE